MVLAMELEKPLKKPPPPHRQTDRQTDMVRQ